MHSIFRVKKVLFVHIQNGKQQTQTQKRNKISLQIEIKRMEKMAERV